MRFSNYLIEGYKSAKTILNESHDLVLQKVIDAVDHAHVNYSAEKISFDIGVVADTSQLKGLGLVIRPAKTDSVRLAQNGDGKYFIVIDTTEEMPGRSEIDTFLASNKVHDGFKRAYKSYTSKYLDKTKEYTKTDSQVKLETNNREAFESAYVNLITAVENSTSEYQSSLGEIDKELDRIANAGRRTALELAKDKLRDEYLGKSAQEFISKVMKFPEAEFVKHLDKEWKAKLDGRLTTYFNEKHAD